MDNERQPSISTHVLDLESGLPAAGVSVTIALLEDGAERRQRSAETNADGRIPSLLEGPLQPGSYRLRFDVAGYFSSRGEPPPFMSTVTLDVRIDDVSRHYHIPLLISRYSCASYRGS